MQIGANRGKKGKKWDTCVPCSATRLLSDWLYGVSRASMASEVSSANSISSDKTTFVGEKRTITSRSNSRHMYRDVVELWKGRCPSLSKGFIFNLIFRKLRSAKAMNNSRVK